MNGRNAGFTMVEAVISVTILLLIAGVIMGSISSYNRATALADNNMLVNAENSRALATVREDLMQTSRNFSGSYAPRIHAGTSELRLRRVNGFNKSAGRATYESRWACYYLDTSEGLLYRRYRDLSGNLLTDPPAKAVAQFVTAFTPVIDADAQTVTITLTTSKGRSERSEDIAVTRTIIIRPYSID
jgi:type II secretory pathway pseudopilin PulG